eukprot:g10663.t1
MKVAIRYLGIQDRFCSSQPESSRTSSPLDVVVKHVDVGKDEGILLLFHGCTHQADHWEFLPEEQRFLQVAAQQYGLGWIAFETPLGATRGWCWPQDAAGVEVVHRKVQAVLAEVLEPGDHVQGGDRERAKNLREKVYCVGGSSGGNLIGLLGAAHPDLCKGFASPPRVSRAAAAWCPGQNDVVREKCPGDLYVQEAEEQQRLATSSNNAPQLCKTICLGPRALSKDELEAAVTIDGEKRAAGTASVFEELALMNYVDRETGRLLRDPRADPGWQGRLFRGVRGRKSMSAAQTKALLNVEELLNRGYGEHEFASDKASTALEFLLGRSKVDALGAGGDAGGPDSASGSWSSQPDRDDTRGNKDNSQQLDASKEADLL